MATVESFNVLKNRALSLKSQLDSANAQRLRLGFPPITIPSGEQIGNFTRVQLSDDPFEADAQEARMRRFVSVLENLVRQAKSADRASGGQYGPLVLGLVAVVVLFAM